MIWLISLLMHPGYHFLEGWMFKEETLGADVKRWNDYLGPDPGSDMTCNYTIFLGKLLKCSVPNLPVYKKV